MHPPCFGIPGQSVTYSNKIRSHYLKTLDQSGYIFRIQENVDEIVIRKRVQNTFDRQLCDKISESCHRARIVQQNDDILGTRSRFNVPRPLSAIVHIDTTETMVFPAFCRKMSHYAQIGTEILP